MKDNTTTPPINPHTLDALWDLQKIILETPDYQGVVARVVNSILIELGYLRLGYRILVLTLVDQKTHTLKRIALSQTPEAGKAVAASPIPFEQIEIPLDAEDNLLIRTLKDKKVYITHSWPDIFRPVLTDEAARHNQDAAGIKTSMLYPLTVKGGVIGVMIFSLVKGEEEVSDEEKELISRFTDIVGLAVQNAQLYTSVRDTAEELRLANERLQSLDKLKDEFVSLASHELRTPLSAIKSYLWVLLRQSPNMGPLNENQKHYVEQTYASTERLIKLVHDMLDVSRIESGRLIIKTQPTNLEQLAKEVMTEVLPTAQGQGLTLTVVPASAPLPLVLADSDKIKEVLINLIGNSVKFTPSGGKITVSFVQQGDMIVTSVSDTGEGMKKEDMPKLFQKFGMIESNYTTTPLAMGTGLGLYISKSIIELHGGTISVFSEGENRGTTFTFSLKKV